MLCELNLEKVGTNNFSEPVVFNGEKEQSQIFHLKNLVIDDELVIRNYNGEKLILENCIFRKNVILKNLHIKKKIDILNSVFEQDLDFYATQTQLLEFSEVENSNISIESSSVKEIKFTGVVSKNFSLIKSEELKSLSLVDCEISAVSLLISISNNIKIANSRIENLVLLKYTQIENIHASLKQLEIKEIQFTDRQFTKELKSIFNNKELNKSGKKAELSRRGDLYLALYNSFIERNQFEEADLMLYRVRILNNYYKQSISKNMYERFTRKIVGVISRFCFGWGIRISQNMLTSCFIIFSFAVFYSFRFPLSENFFFTFSNHLTQSTMLFFDAGEPEEYYGIYGVVEEIIGIFMITVLTGVVVRKIIK